MRYYKIIENGYVVVIGTGLGGIEIAAEEYAQLQEIICSRPEPAAGYDYRLKEDLSWEEYALPEPDPDPEITDDEALDIILGGESA